MFFLLLFLFSIKHEAYLAIKVRTFVNQKDMSEQCKRRVIPSVFLGKQVMEANSYVLHFSQLEVPYSCSLSVRTENGYNIIMIIQLPVDLHKACWRNHDQFIVYELGETFGGYWGQIPDAAMMKKTDRNHSKFYTLKTTRSTTITQRTLTYKEETEKMLKQKLPTTDKEPDYIRMEVPLVNVSGNLQLGGPLRHTYNVEEMFDFIYDVTPRNGVEYSTSIMPLVQFSIRQQGGRDRYGEAPRYELDYAYGGVTLNTRLSYSTTKKRFSSRKSNWFQKRRYNFGRQNTALFSRKQTSIKKYYTPWSAFMISGTMNDSVMPTLDSKYSTASWKYMDDIIKFYNVTLIPSTKIRNVKIKNFLKKISDMEHNSSVYINPNISIYDKHDEVANKFSTKKLGSILSRFNTLPKFKTSTSISNLYEESTTSLRVNDSKTYDENSVAALTESSFLHYNDTVLTNKRLKYLADDKILDENVTIESFSTAKDIEIDDVTKVLIMNKSGTLDLFRNGTLVDHESWENVVQAAPVMAVILNKSEQNFSGRLYRTTQISYNTTEKLSKSKQKKRHIKALEIEKSRPRNLTTKWLLTRKAEPPFKFSDMQDLGRLVELQDDETEDRVALRYLRNYVGSALFNICDHEAPTNQMFLFNASRIVIAVNNFTIENMMLVLTPALVLLSNTSRCPPEHLECQIIGTRVCIDSMNACDGIPNCGSYDIYDEDRIVCGAKGLQHNVYLAAFAFLAVLLTMVYTVHYWLKRCVPGVSQAFFIYADSSENALLLDTIMRSPTDLDDVSYKFIYPGQFFDDDMLRDYKESDGKVNICTRILKIFCRLFFCKKKLDKKTLQQMAREIDRKPSKRFSFTELELRKYTAISSKDQTVQTGKSIEDIKESIERKQKKSRNIKTKDESPKNKTIKKIINDNKYANELKIIKFVKKIKSSSTQSDSIENEQTSIKLHRRHAIIKEDEKEIKSTVYDRHSRTSFTFSDIVPVTCEIHPRSKRLADTSKRLRFEASPTVIPSMDNEEDDNIILENRQTNNHNIGCEVQETSSISRDFMRFWSTKSKKDKKKGKQSYN